MIKHQDTRHEFSNAIHIWHYALIKGDQELLEIMEKVIKIITYKYLDEEDRANYETEH
jgi:enoyl-[acyl-carrier-protein] reductase (NADH)